MTREQEIKDEIAEQRKSLNRYVQNIESLFGKKDSKEVLKSMINHLVNKL